MKYNKLYTKHFKANPLFYSSCKKGNPSFYQNKKKHNPAKFSLKMQRARFKAQYYILLRARSKFNVYSINAYKKALYTYIFTPKPLTSLYSPFKSRYRKFLHLRCCT